MLPDYLFVYSDDKLFTWFFFYDNICIDGIAVEFDFSSNIAGFDIHLCLILFLKSIGCCHLLPEAHLVSQMAKSFVVLNAISLPLVGW